MEFPFLHSCPGRLSHNIFGLLPRLSRTPVLLLPRALLHRDSPQDMKSLVASLSSVRGENITTATSPSARRALLWPLRGGCFPSELLWDLLLPQSHSSHLEHKELHTPSLHHLKPDHTEHWRHLAGLSLSVRMWLHNKSPLAPTPVTPLTCHRGWK